MFMHAHHFCLDNRALLTGMLFGSALAVQAELEASKRRELEQTEDERKRASGVPSLERQK